MKTQTKTEIKTLLWIIALIFITGFISKQELLKPVEAQAPYSRENNTFPVAEDKKNLSVVDKIVINWTKVNHQKMPLNEAVDIAICESNLGKNKRNWQGSTASGVYMFINSTWDNYCDGYQMDDDNNIKCFFELYPKHKSWWACTSIMGYL